MLFAANMYVREGGETRKYSARVEALSWEEAADRAEELGLVPCGPIIMRGRCEPFTVDEHYPEADNCPPCPINLRHRFER